VNRTGPRRRFTFVLTLEEKKVICFILLAFVLGFVTKHYRDKQPAPTPPAIKATATAKRSPPPNKKIREERPGPERESGK
jgi:cell division protein FtsN